MGLQSVQEEERHRRPTQGGHHAREAPPQKSMASASLDITWLALIDHFVPTAALTHAVQSFNYLIVHLIDFIFNYLLYSFLILYLIYF